MKRLEKRRGFDFDDQCVLPNDSPLLYSFKLSTQRHSAYQTIATGSRRSQILELGSTVKQIPRLSDKKNNSNNDTTTTTTPRPSGHASRSRQTHGVRDARKRNCTPSPHHTTIDDCLICTSSTIGAVVGFETANSIGDSTPNFICWVKWLAMVS